MDLQIGGLGKGAQAVRALVATAIVRLLLMVVEQPLVLGEVSRSPVALQALVAPVVGRTCTSAMALLDVLL